MLCKAQDFDRCDSIVLDFTDLNGTLNQLDTTESLLPGVTR